MNLQSEQLLTDQEDTQQQKDNQTKVTVTRVDEDGGADEASLKKNYFMGGEDKNANAPGMEGEGMGGQNFGGANHPPTGDDPANPSRNAGYSNAYLARTEPLEEVTENNNFKAKGQEGEPDYQTSKVDNVAPDKSGAKPSAGEEGNTSEPDKADFKEGDQHGPDYGSNSPDNEDIPGPSELPEQQKVGGA